MKSLKRQRKAFTLVEVMIVVAISALVTVSILGTFGFVMRAQATAANQAMVRLRSDNVVDQLLQDIQNTSRGRYNATPSYRLSYFGTGAAANSWRVTLLDTVMGSRISWSYASDTGLFTRRVETYSNSATPTVSSKTYDQRFADFRIEETLRSDFEVVTPTGTVDNQTITGLRLWGRAFLTLNPYHTTFQEVDGNGDGDYRNDQVGAQIFGRVFRGDDPRWQYIFNVSGTFRNT
ncbi:prepilin-type N-terminal cleavage/methylation domain-containing protein [bacterium]|nr:prepilin-type N-terminal cleavage/methylation domain-containing protein [bacterium]